MKNLLSMSPRYLQQDFVVDGKSGWMCPAANSSDDLFVTARYIFAGLYLSNDRTSSAMGN
jgi:hypothetical protein